MGVRRVLALRFSPAPGPKQESPSGGNPACGVGPGDPIRMGVRRVLALRFSPAPGPKQESPSGGNPACGVGPGDPIRMRIRPALKGRNKILDHKPVLPLQGVATFNTRPNYQGDALGWHVAAPLGRNSGSATSKLPCRGNGVINEAGCWNYLVGMTLGAIHVSQVPESGWPFPLPVRSPRGPGGQRRCQCALSKHHLCSTVAVPGFQIDATASASRYHGLERNPYTPAVRFHWRQAVRNGMQTKAGSTVPSPANHEAEPPCRAASGSAIPIAVAHPFLSRRSFVILARRSRPLF